MAIINFPKSRALRVLEAAVTMSKPIHVVKDHGVYIMVFGHEDEDNIVEYGNGYDPEKNDNWYDKSLALGGDDICEEYDDFEFFAKLIELKDKWKTLRVHINKNTLKISAK